jgi:hypothetical protein
VQLADEELRKAKVTSRVPAPPPDPVWLRTRLLTMHVVEVADGVVVDAGVVVEAEGVVVEVDFEVDVGLLVVDVVVDEGFFDGFVECEADFVPPEHPTSAAANKKKKRRIRTPRPIRPIELSR